jgi:phosphate transport system substrate-binding protein
LKRRKKLRSLRITALGILLSAGLGAVASAESPFEPNYVAAGTLRLWGDSSMSSVVLAWEERFNRYHPEVKFETSLMGTDTAMPAIYTGLADIGLFGRDSNQTENDGFLHTLQYKPLQLRLMTGSLDAPGKSYALVLFVHKDNPLERLTLAQIDLIFGCGQSGQSAPARTWGDVGVGGEWRDKPIRLYTFDTESGTGLFLQRKQQGESRKMNWAVIREFADARRTDGTSYEAGEQTMDALLHDRYGLAVSSLRYANSSVKTVALAGTSGSEYVKASRETLINGTYPLTRMTYAFVNQPPGQSVSPLVKEFLRFVYSEEGQGMIEESSGFLPLTKEDAAKQVLLLQ